jgi:hypothetical protein
MKVLNSFLQWFDETKLWHFLSKNIIAHLTFRFHGYPGFDFDKWPELEKQIQLASDDENCFYVWVLADRKSLSSILVRWVSRSDWSHAGIALDKKAYHMKGKGLVEQGFLSLVHECDDFALVKVPVSDIHGVRRKARYYSERVGMIHYDFEQELEQDAAKHEKQDLYCSELCFVVLKDFTKLQPSVVAGRLAFSPDDVYKSGTIVFEHRTK